MFRKNGKPAGCVTDIQTYTIHDGPGIRTEIFFKGCNLNCPWCSNPETKNLYPQLGIYTSKCIGKEYCASCLDACPLGGASPLRFSEEGSILPFRTANECAGCLLCAKSCPAESIRIWGTFYTVDELMEIILKDRGFYERSGGGVTLNGGEVLLQREFAELLADAIKEQGISLCIESALNVPWEHAQILLKADYVISDLKCMDSEKHKKLVGSGNEQILDNLIRLAKSGVRMVLRTPVVPDINDDEENIRAAARFIKEKLGGCVLQYQLLPYRKIGTEKLDTLGEAYPMEDYAVRDREIWEPRLRELAEIAKSCGIPASAGYETAWR